MTRNAADTFRDVRAVIEVGVIGQVVHAHPLDRLAAPPALKHSRELGTLRFHARVAVHAHGRRRHARVAAPLRARMAVLTIELIETRVERM